MAKVDETSAFFERLSRRGHEPMLANAKGTVRVELVDKSRLKRWLVKVDRGDVTVSQGNGAADLTLRAEKELFDRLARGRTNATAAVLRGEIAIEGSWDLLVLFQRLFPGPKG